MVSNMINDLLDLAKLQNNSFSFTKEYFNMNQMLFESIQMMLHQINSRGIHIHVEIDHPQHINFLESIYGDRQRFQQVVLNFISNSIKFTPKGG
jgi:signal transduction histidine kinase